MCSLSLFIPWIAQFLLPYSQRRKNWDLLKNSPKKMAGFFSWYFLHVLPLSFSTSRQCFNVFRQCFAIKKCYLKKVVFVFCASAFSQCLRSTNTLMLGSWGLPSSSGGPRYPRGLSWSSWGCSRQPWWGFGLCKGQPSRMMRKKPLLTERMRIQRLEFSNAYRHWDEDDWKQVMFSNESQEHRGGNRQLGGMTAGIARKYWPKWQKLLSLNSYFW